MRIGFLLILILIALQISAQQPDTVSSKDPNRAKELAGKLLNSIKRDAPEPEVFTIKSEDAFLPYDGKIIRKIHYEQLGFDRTVIDTTRNIKTFFARAANQLHKNSRPWVIKHNVFLKEGRPLNAFRVADNERYLRDLDFILDSRIFVLPISEDSDSVDLLIMTRDVFSLGASFSPRSATESRFKIQDANLGGLGQRLQYTGIWDTERNPQWGQEILYRHINLLGTFVDATAGYTQINNAASVGNENESAWYVRLNRPLFNPFTRWAGGLEWSKNNSVNVYGEEEATFARYQYRISDLWAGYSFGLKNLPGNIRENRNRKFVSARAYQRHYDELPSTPLSSREKLIYGDRTSLLSQITFFRQDFYKTRYVLGFGRTEDVPYGYKISYTSGWEKELDRKRLYAGLDFYWNHVNESGTFYTYTIKAASYWRDGQTEDGLINLNFNRFSKIYSLGKSNIRHQLDIGYSQQFRRVVKNELDIRESNGLFGFRPDSLAGSRRLTLRSETIVFTPWKILGFHLAPVARIDLAYLAQVHETVIQKSNFYSGYSLALRARNENLIFNTVEARVYYFSKTVENLTASRIELRANLRIKYPTSLVTPPGTVYDP